MKSNTCYLYKHKGRDLVLEEVEKTAEYCELGHKQQLQLRLLAEELVGIAEGVAGECRGIFWLEEKEKNFELHLQMEKPKESAGRETLINISSRKRNEAALGFMGKIRAFFEESMANYEELGVYCAKNGIQMSPVSDMFASSMTCDDTMVWTLQNYQRREIDEGRKEKWDELERSIVANLADDVLVTMKGRHVEIVVKKKF